jgi:hypothetical protein
MTFIRVLAFAPEPPLCNPERLGLLLFRPVVANALGAVLPKDPIVAEAYVLVPTKSVVPGVIVELLLSRNSPLKRNACVPRVQLNVSEKVHVGVFPFDVGATLQPAAVPAAGAFVGGLEP